MKIVHFAQDEKFVPLAQRLFEEAFPRCNTYLVPRPRSGSLKYITDTANVQLKRSIYFKLASLLAWRVRSADLLVVHGMSRLFARGLQGVRPGCGVVWIGYGFDYYPLLEDRLGGLLLDRTEQFQAASVPLGGPARRRRPPLIARVAGRIDAFSVNPSEVDLLRAALPELRARYHSLPSFTVEDVFDRGPAVMDGPDILVGESASPSNNHLEAFECLSALVGDKRRLLVPLSYGKADYAERIAQAGAERFGERFVALKQWLPIEEYNARLQNCGFVVMNHRRQKAVGTIGAALYKGAKVFLRPENPLFGFYAGLGIVIHSTEALEAGDAAAFVPLSPADRQRNREAVYARWGRPNVLAGIRSLTAYAR